MFNTPPSHCCAYAERTVRGVDADNVRDILIQHFATDEVGPREIQAFMIGIRMGAHGGFMDGRRIYGASATTLNSMHRLLMDAKLTIDDLPALEVFARAAKLFEDEVRQQTNSHAGLQAVINESRWQVPLGFLTPGVEPDDEYLEQIGTNFYARNPILVNEINRIGVDMFLKEVANPRPFAEQVRNPHPTIQRSEPITLIEIGRFALTEARKDYNEYMERGMDVFTPEPDHAEAEDLMTRLMRREEP